MAEAERQRTAATTKANHQASAWANSSYEARRAHAEIESYANGRDNLRELYNPQDGRTRAEHASHLNHISQEAREAFERGATIYGETLIIPRESIGKPTNADQIRAGSHAHAVREFTPLVGDEQAKTIAAEFVELGRAIAGRTGDGTTRLVVFQNFYHEITHDPATGKRRTPTEQTAQIEPTLERMRHFAREMRAEEWKRDKAELIPVEDWEHGFESRQRDAEYETHGRLTYRIESIGGFEQDETEEHERERAEPLPERSEIGALPGIEYERVKLDREPPRLPDGLTEQEEGRLRHQIIPRIDRQLENGTRPRDIIGSLYRDQRAEESRALDEEASRTLTARYTAANSEHTVTRAEELRALFVLRTLIPDAPNNVEQRQKINEEITRRAPTERERADAIDSTGGRLATGYRAISGRLKTYDAAEEERERLHGEAIAYREWVRAGAEFQSLRQRFAEEEMERGRVERNALTFADNAPHANRQNERRQGSNYPELVGEQPTLSAFAQLQQTHERERTDARDALSDRLINPAIEHAQLANFAEIEKHRSYFSRLTLSEIGSAQEARAALAPKHERVRETLRQLHSERSHLNADGARTPERDARPVFISLAADGGVRLPVANVNEYRTFAKLARNLNLPIRVFESLHGREITGASGERDEVYDFARQYVAYRVQDEGTRLRNENRSFREFGARLDRVHTTGELQATLNDIRRENYNRAAHPEQFAEERQEDRRRGEQTRRPLSFNEMRSLLLAPAPEHYTDEMREVRISRDVSVHDKAQRLASLARGTTEPSLALSIVLREFDRTRHDSPTRMVRNIKSFLGDYLNPPSSDRNRFSRENLYELRKQLDPTEQSYVFQLVTDTKQALAQGTPVKEIERSFTEARHQELSDRSRQHNQNSTLEVARTPYESLSFRLYYGASVWREAATLAEGRHGSISVEESHDRNRQPLVRGVHGQDLETAAVLLAHYAKQPKMIDAAAEHLRMTNEDRQGRLGEILTTFREMKVSREPEGQLRFQITTPANSTLDREEWTRLLDEFPQRIHGASDLRLPEAQRREIRRTAFNLAWSDLQRGEQQSNLVHDQAVPEGTDELRRAIERGGELQLRARTASDVLERSFAAHTERAERALQAKGLSPDDAKGLQTLTRIALDPQRAPEYEQRFHNQASDSQATQPAKVNEQLAAIRSVLTPREQRQHQEFVAYAARARGEYLESFGSIDEQLQASTRDARQEREWRAMERKDSFMMIREGMETKVAAYLTGVVREGGVAALEAGRVQHTDAVSRIIKGTFQQAGYDLSTFNLNDERVNTVTANLVKELPATLRARRELAETHDREHKLGEIARRDALLPNHDTALVVHAHAAPVAGNIRRSVPQREATTPQVHNLDDEFVEQRVSHSIGQMHEQTLTVASSPHSPANPQPLNKTTAHELNADHQREQFTHRYVLTR